MVFKGEVWYVSGSWVVTVPMAYVKNGMVPTGTELQFAVVVPEVQR